MTKRFLPEGPRSERLNAGIVRLRCPASDSSQTHGDLLRRAWVWLDEGLHRPQLNRRSTGREGGVPPWPADLPPWSQERLCPGVWSRNDSREPLTQVFAGLASIPSSCSRQSYGPLSFRQQRKSGLFGPSTRGCSRASARSTAYPRPWLGWVSLLRTHIVATEAGVGWWSWLASQVPLMNVYIEGDWWEDISWERKFRHSNLRALGIVLVPGLRTFLIYRTVQAFESRATVDVAPMRPQPAPVCARSKSPGRDGRSATRWQRSRGPPPPVLTRFEEARPRRHTSFRSSMNWWTSGPPLRLGVPHVS